MPSLAEHVEGFAATLRAAGIVTATDIRELSAPGALLEVQTLQLESLAGDSVLAVSVALVAQDSGTTTALAQLSTLLDRFLSVGGQEFATPPDTDGGGPTFTAAVVVTPAGRLPSLAVTCYISTSIGRTNQ